MVDRLHGIPLTEMIGKMDKPNGITFTYTLVTDEFINSNGVIRTRKECEVEHVNGKRLYWNVCSANQS